MKLLTIAWLIFLWSAALAGCGPTSVSVGDGNMPMIGTVNVNVYVEKGAVSLTVQQDPNQPLVNVGPFTFVPSVNINGHLMTPAPAGVPASKHLMLYPGAEN